MSWKTYEDIFHSRKKCQRTPVSLSEKFQGQRCLAGCSPWGHKESNTTEWLSTHVHMKIFLLRNSTINENVYESCKLVEFRNMNKRLKYVLMNTVIKEFKKIYLSKIKWCLFPLKTLIFDVSSLGKRFLANISYLYFLCNHP